MKKLLKTGAVAWLAYRVMDFFIHMIVFKNDYLEMADLYRADMMDFMWIFMLGSVFVIYAITYLYSMLDGNTNNKVVNFGAAMATIIMLPGAFYTYASIPMPLDFAVKWFVIGFIQVMLTVKVISLMYDKR